MPRIAAAWHAPTVARRSNGVCRSLGRFDPAPAWPPPASVACAVRAFRGCPKKHGQRLGLLGRCSPGPRLAIWASRKTARDPSSPQLSEARCQLQGAARPVRRHGACAAAPSGSRTPGSKSGNSRARTDAVAGRLAASGHRGHRQRRDHDRRARVAQHASGGCNWRPVRRAACRYGRVERGVGQALDRAAALFGARTAGRNDSGKARRRTGASGSYPHPTGRSTQVIRPV